MFYSALYYKSKLAHASGYEFAVPDERRYEIIFYIDFFLGVSLFVFFIFSLIKFFSFFSRKSKKITIVLAGQIIAVALAFLWTYFAHMQFGFYTIYTSFFLWMFFFCVLWCIELPVYLYMLSKIKKSHSRTE